MEIALRSDGAVGYVQPIGDKAIPGQVVDQNSTTNFGVAAFLLASIEMYRYVKYCYFLNYFLSTKKSGVC